MGRSAGLSPSRCLPSIEAEIFLIFREISLIPTNPWCEQSPCRRILCRISAFSARPLPPATVEVNRPARGKVPRASVTRQRKKRESTKTPRHEKNRHHRRRNRRLHRSGFRLHQMQLLQRNRIPGELPLRLLSRNRQKRLAAIRLSFQPTVVLSSSPRQNRQGRGRRTFENRQPPTPSLSRGRTTSSYFRGGYSFPVHGSKTTLWRKSAWLRDAIVNPRRTAMASIRLSQRDCG